MKGSPLTRTALTVLILFALGFPLRQLTGHRLSAPVSTAPTPIRNETQKVHLELTSTTAPFHFIVTHEGKPIWEGDSNSTQVSHDADLRIPASGVDLVLDVSWTGERDTAVKLALTPEHGDTIERTIWGRQQASEVLTFVPGV
jgi:hypothetical protein